MANSTIERFRKPGLLFLIETAGLAGAFATISALLWPDSNKPLVAVGSIALVLAILAFVDNPGRSKVALGIVVLAASATPSHVELGQGDGSSLSLASDGTTPPRRGAVAAAHLDHLAWRDPDSLTGAITADHPACTADRELLIEVIGSSTAWITTHTNDIGEWKVADLSLTGEVRVQAEPTTEWLRSGRALTCEEIEPVPIARANPPRRERGPRNRTRPPPATGVSVAAPIYITPTVESVDIAGASSNSASKASESDAPAGRNQGWGDADTVEPINHE